MKFKYKALLCLACAVLIAEVLADSDDASGPEAEDLAEGMFS